MKEMKGKVKMKNMLVCGVIGGDGGGGWATVVVRGGLGRWWWWLGDGGSGWGLGGVGLRRRVFKSFHSI